MSLRIRLTAVSSMLILIGMLLGIAFQVVQARQRVSEELDAATELVSQLLDAILPPPAGSANTELNSNLLAKLERIEAVRHLDIRVLRNGESLMTLSAAQANLTAPRWFIRLVQVPELEHRRALDASGSQVLEVRSNAAAEINEIWQESRDFLFLLLLILLVFNGFLYVTVGRWLAPVQRIVLTLERAEQGDFNDEVPTASLPELRTIADKLNQLTKVLRSSKAENARLAALSLQIQEDERRNLARELHDEMGQALSAIKAIAWSLAKRAQSVDANMRQGAEKISGIAADMSMHVKTMLGRLRPVLLDELGFIPALQHMVQEWNDHHKGCTCTLTIAPEFAELTDVQRIHLYRIVQEALTNVARHAQAKHVVLVLSANADFHVQIHDDGNGFDVQQPKTGMGLNGMRERCQALGGQLLLVTQPGAGVRYTLTFPRT
jgi:two-component system, NarL family, sensor histidine kinase UhpB